MASQGQGANQSQNQQPQAQGQGQDQAPPQNPRAFGRNIHEPLNFTQILGYPHDLLDKAYKRLPKFSGEGLFNARDHLLEFWSVCTEMKVNALEDVMMRLFCFNPRR